MQGAYQAAQNIAQGEIGPRNTPKDLLWNLQAGALARLLKQYAASNAYFDRAEDGFRYYDQQDIAGKTAQESRGIFFNDSARPYTGKVHDRVMVNTYKALNYMALGNAKNARVEFNRAIFRQNQAKAFFSEQVQEIRIRPAKEEFSSGPESETVEATLENPELEDMINERYQNLNDFKAYADFINPFTPYIAGLFFWLEGDTAKAAGLLKEAHALNSANAIVAADFARAADGKIPDRELWVIFENGLAPCLEETRFDVPLISEDLPITYIGIALPKLEPGEEAYPSLTLSAGGATAQTELLADMETGILAEFRKELPSVITREVTRSVLKTYIQYQMGYNYGFFAGVAGGLYQAVTTAVDTRSWTALPYQFQLAHLPIPADGRLTVSVPEGEPIGINIPSGSKNVILYVRIVYPGVEPVIDLIHF
jgi:hypothetical protein